MVFLIVFPLGRQSNISIKQWRLSKEVRSIPI